MRLWSLHPSYVDAKGLVAWWREGLLARKVLQGLTRGYQHHPQLTRFKEASEPLATIDQYLLAVYLEAAARGYAFTRAKIAPSLKVPKLVVTTGQLAYEFQHLQHKLKVRDAVRWKQLKSITQPQPHPLFRVRAGAIAQWEKVS
jgi:hypothetical protein